MATASEAEYRQFHNARLADRLRASQLLDTRFGAANNDTEEELPTAENTNQEIPDRQRTLRAVLPNIPEVNERLDSPEQLKSLVGGLEAQLTEERGREYGNRLGEYLNKKINEGSFAAMMIGFLLSITIDILDGTAGWAFDFGIPLLGTIFEWAIENIVYVALILVIRKQISFFKRGLLKLIIKILIIPMIIEAIPILEGISPTYTLMMFYIYYKHRKDIKIIKTSYTEVQETVKKQLVPNTRKQFANFRQHQKLAA